MEIVIMGMNKEKYPPDWDEMSLRLRNEVGWCCEWCGAKYGEPHPETGSIVVLSVAHLNHDTTQNERDNLAVLCARCHLRYDAKYHAANAKRTRQRKKQLAAQQSGQMELFE
jgi:5-methylcytosine-specific restriction endonuclease McrA